MSILIRSMEMPQNCIECPFMISRDNDDCILQSDEANAKFDSWDDMKASCPLVEVMDNPRDSNGRFSSGLNEDWTYIEPIIGEEWKPIRGYEERYMVSNMGRVRSRTKVLKASTGNIYAQVILNNGDVRHRKTVTVHRLVAEAFVENPLPNEYKYINHKDENKRNNKADNLEWCTAKYNLAYGKSAPIHNLKNYHSAPTVIEAEGSEDD